MKSSETISARQAVFLKALHAAFGDAQITTRTVSSRVTGLALKEPGNAALLQALVGCRGRVINAEKIGRLLEKVRGRRLGDLELACDGEKVGGHWRYYVKDHAVAPIPAPDLDAIERDRREAALAFEAELEEMSPLKAAAAMDKQWNKQEREKAAAQREVDKAAAKAAIEAAAQREVAAAAERAAADADATTLHTRVRASTTDRLAIISVVNRPEQGVEARLHGDDKFGAIAILLRGTMAERKYRFERLVALFHSKHWCSPYEQPLDGMTAELLHGREIPNTASQDPAHYGTVAGHEQLAVRLLLAGISSDDLSLEEFAYQQRQWSWGHGVGGGTHRMAGMHADVRGAIRMKRCDPLAGQIEAACGEPEFTRKR